MKHRFLIFILSLLALPLTASAQYWESGTTKTGSVSKNVHDVWYTISLPEDGEVSISYERLLNIGGENLTLYAIVDSVNVQRAFAWVDGQNKTLTCPNLKPGVYRVKLNAGPKDSKYSGTYRLTYTFTAPTVKTDPTPNDTWDDCPLLQDGVTLGGHMGYAYGTADVDKDDWFRIDVPKDGKLTIEARTAKTLKFGLVTLNALNAEGTDVQQRNNKWFDIADSTIVWEIPDVARGIYYLHLPHYGGYGVWHLTYRFTPSPIESDPELNDTWQTASLLTDGVQQTAHLGHYYNQNTYIDKADWYKVVVPEDGKLTIETRTAPTLKIGLATLNALKPDGTDVVQRNNKWLDIADKTLVWEIPDVSEGTYYLCMPHYGGYGHYTLTYYFTGHSAEADPEPNDTWQTATALRSGPSNTGQLGYDYKNTKDVNDWYLLPVPEEGTITLTVCSEPTLKIGLASINSLKGDSTLTQRINKWLDTPGDTLTFTLTNAAAGNYYLCLPHYSGYGTYFLRYVFTPCSRQNDAEPNDDWTTAAEFADGTTMDARLGYDYSNSMDTKDWFRLDVPEEGSINLTIRSEKTLKIGLASINSAKNDSTLTQRVNKWLDIADSTLVFTLNNAAAGAYYLNLPHYGGYGGYQMTYNFTPCAMANDAADNDTWQTATPIDQGTTREGRLGYDYSNSLDNQDWFRLDVPEEGSINLTIRSEKTLKIGLASINTAKNDSTLTQRVNKWLDIADSTLVFTLNNAAPGAYYLNLPHYSGYGGYRVTYDFTPCAIANDVAGNDSIGSATPIENGTTTQGRLGYDYSNSLDNQDWYKFVMTADGSASFTIQSEQTLKIGLAYIYALNEDGTKVVGRESMWLDHPGDTLIFHRDDLAAGTYYLCLPHYSGYGGYTVKSQFTKNPFYKEKLGNTDFDNRLVLEEGVTVQGTLGYSYRGNDTATEAWFDLGLMHGRQIDVSVVVESSHSLSIGVACLYIYKGMNDNGKPILQQVASQRLERSSGTISYIDKNTEDSHYIFYLPRYNGYGGYAVTLGSDRPAGSIDLAGTSVSVMTEGRNTVRKGVPCDNPITITNTSKEKTGKFIVTIAATDNIDILGFRLPGKRGQQYLPVDSVTVTDNTDCRHTVAFLVPSLDPWESYTFTMVSEGKGDIAYSRTQQELDLDGQEGQAEGSRRKIRVDSGTYAIVAVMGQVAGADKQLFVSDFIVHRIGDIYELTGEQRLKVSQLIDKLDSEKQETGVAAYSILSLLKRASDLCDMTLTDVLCPITGDLRHRINQWVFLDDQIIPDDVPGIIDGKAAINDVVASWDPNEMVGPQGVGDEHYIGPTQTISYRILFENKAEAGDAAYRIRISDTLDPEVFDLSTVRFGETSHDGIGYNWKMKREDNTLSWDIEGIELPPNVNAPEGEGYVTFSVDLKPGLAHGTQIKNQATIIFDKNFPIETNEFVNTLDLMAPTTQMAYAVRSTDKTKAKIVFRSEDTGAGVASYLLFASKDGGDYEYAGQYFDNSADYAVMPESEYSFYVLAVDAVGNAESFAPEAMSLKDGIQGDVNVDGHVDVADIANVISIMSGEDRLANGDVNGDGKVDVADIATVISIMAK